MAGKRKAAAAEPASRPPWDERLRAGVARLAGRTLTHFLLPILIPCLVVLFGLIGLQVLQSALRARSGPLPTAFADIDCPSPPGLTRREFLDDVQAYANLPDRLDRNDPDLPPRLAEAFAASPWVARVERITPTPDGLRVELALRVAVLAVPLDGRHRAVDGQGVLLPERATRQGLPHYAGKVEVPPTRPGAVWPDPRLTAAAAVAAELAPNQDRLRVVKLDDDHRGVLLRTAWRRTIVWGSPPGAELAGEPSPADKLDRLFRALAESAASEVDLRR